MTKRPEIHASGNRLYYADQVKYAQGERVKTADGWPGVIVSVPYAVTKPCYYVLLDGKEKSEIIAEYILSPE